MIKDTIGNIFDFISETNLVEEHFYNNKGEYPVFSGQTEKGGIVAYIDTYNQNGPCITFTTYGQKAGKIFYRKGNYTIGRNCMGLRSKDKYKDKINLMWFSYKFQNLFHRLRIGELEGQRSLNKTLLENVKITIPDKLIQEKQLKTYAKTQYLQDNIDKLLEHAENFIKTKIQITEYIYDEEIKKIFDIIGGNSGLTEEFIYYNQPNNEEEKIPILSSATLDNNLMGYVSRIAKINGKKLKIFKGLCILVARNGYAGTMTYIENERFTTNDHAYVLILKKEWKEKINLRWFVHQYQELFYNLVTSKSDNATFNKEYAEKQKVKIPDIKVQISIAEKLQKIDYLMKNFQFLKEKIENLVECEVA